MNRRDKTFYKQSKKAVTILKRAAQLAAKRKRSRRKVKKVK